jgi:hypothetical protein
MRLLECNAAGEIRLTKEFLDDDVPLYAILSHTWGPEEVSFKDLTGGMGKNKLGYSKIQFCKDQAWHDGLRYFWVDTCCIDKASSAELQETINCMFRFYGNAAKCYVYLADVSRPSFNADDKSSQQPWELAFRKSRWFTRGWTLQELIAPLSVEFFSKEGVRLGSRRSLEDQIHNITGIPLNALRNSPLSEFGVSERMAWIEKRETTRKEDKAYSLLGIFDVHMPLLYGEGREKAFRRLREEIDKASKSELPPIPIANDAAFEFRAEEHNVQASPISYEDQVESILSEERRLLSAAQYGHERLVQLLLDNGVDIEAKDTSGDGMGDTPLHRASRNGHEKVVALLLKRGADHTYPSGGFTALHRAADNGQEGVARVLLDNGAKINAMDKFWGTALHRAVLHGDIGMTQLLLERRADANARSQHESNGMALHQASNDGYDSLVQLLIQHGAEINARDKYGQTPLHKAASNGHEQVVCVLLKAGAYVKARNVYGRTPVESAAEAKQADVVGILSQCRVYSRFDDDSW